MGNFQGRTNPVVYTHQRQAVFVSLVSDIDLTSAPIPAESIGHVGKVEDQVVRSVCPDFGLEFSQRG